MGERREFVRLKSHLTAAYRVADQSPQVTETRNVGGGGICLLTTERLRPGTRLTVELSVPDRPAPVRFTGQVVWSGALLLEPGETRPYTFEAGVQFVDITPADRTFILQRAAAVPPAADAA